MNKICTTIEQSKRLVDLGLDRKTSDMYYWCGSDLRIGGYRAQDEELDVPAWSLSALLELMPNTIQDEDDVPFGLNIKKNFAEYYNPSMGALALYATCYCITAEDTFDAAFEMVCWLLENKKI